MRAGIKGLVVLNWYRVMGVSLESPSFRVCK